MIRLFGYRFAPEHIEYYYEGVTEYSNYNICINGDWFEFGTREGLDSAMKTLDSYFGVTE